MINPDLEGVKKTLQEYQFPVDVIVEITNYCNLRCIMCPYPFLKRKKGEMTFETFKRIIDEVANESPDTRIWLAIMGEPLLIGEKIIEMISYAKNAGIKEINLNTNAVYLSEEMAKNLIESGIDKIIISLDGNSEESYNKIRKGGDFALVVNNTQKILELIKIKKADKPEVIVQFIVMEENEKEVDSFKEFWLDKGAVVKIRPKLGWGNACESSILDKLAKKTERFPCAWLTRTVSIHWDGTFSQCDADHEGTYSPGHLSEISIKQLWNNEIAKRRKRHWDNDYDFEPCKNCKDWLAGRSYFYYPDKKTGAL